MDHPIPSSTPQQGATTARRRRRSGACAAALAVAAMSIHAGSAAAATIDTAGKTFSIANLGSGLVADVSGWSTVSGTRIIQWQVTGGANQHFALAPLLTSRGTMYTIRNVYSQLCLKADASTAPAIYVKQAACSTGSAYLWLFTPISKYGDYYIDNGYYGRLRVRSTASGSYLRLPDRATETTKPSDPYDWMNKPNPYDSPYDTKTTESTTPADNDSTPADSTIGDTTTLPGADQWRVRALVATG